jgi:hypothetical protein
VDVRPAIYKAVLHRRGIIANAALRGPGAMHLDDFDQRELDAILADVSEMFTTAPLVAGDGAARISVGQPVLT